MLVRVKTTMSLPFRSLQKKDVSDHHLLKKSLAKHSEIQYVRSSNKEVHSNSKRVAIKSKCQYSNNLVWATLIHNSKRWWRTGKPGVLQSMGSQRVGHNLATEQQPNSFHSYRSISHFIYAVFLPPSSLSLCVTFIRKLQSSCYY